MRDINVFNCLFALQCSPATYAHTYIGLFNITEQFHLFVVD